MEEEEEGSVFKSVSDTAEEEEDDDEKERLSAALSLSSCFTRQGAGSRIVVGYII